MALPIFSPAIARTREAISSQKAFIKLVPELESGKRVTNKSFTILVSLALVLIALAMFVISSLSTQDAFTLAKLQRQAQTLSDQRDAINRQISTLSSPEMLASQAKKLGMTANTQPRFLDISETSQSANVAVANGQR